MTLSTRSAAASLGRPLIRAFTLLAVLAIALGWSDARPAHAEPTTADVTVIHAVPGLTVDVYVNGDLTLPNFEPETITDPIPLPAGTYDIDIAPAGAGIGASVISGSATLNAGDNASLVAHLAEDGTPILTAFANDLSLADRHEGRAIVRHVAAAPTVDIEVSRRIWRWTRHIATLEDLSNPNGTQADLRAGHYQATIFAADGGAKVAGPAALPIKAGVATFVYAFGSLEGGTFGLLSHTLDLRSTTANVTVVHGVPGLTVDVFVNGALTLPNFEPRTITDVIPLPCGDYDIAIAPAGAGIGAAVITGSATLNSGDDVALVAHLAADGTPKLGVFVNDVSATGWKGRLVVRHAAAAPAVDVPLVRRLFWWRFAAGTIEDAENGQQAAVEVAPGRYIARVTPANVPGTTVLGPATVRIRSNTVTFVYAIGSLNDGTLDLLVQRRSTR